ncbi:NAD-binding protein [Trametes elegans]|nr:NAD-binding protein [Trametes elegans]
MPSYVVTGASRGIGLEFVNQLVNMSGAHEKNIVFALARNPQNSPKLQELRKARPNVHILKADITDVQALKAAADETAKVTGGSLDYLINNAALVSDKREGFTLTSYPTPDLLESDLLAHYRTNVVGVVHTTNAFLPLLRAGAAKKVVALSSGVADPALVLAADFAPAAPYGLSKAALNLAVAKFAAELRPEGFTFLAISPGLVNNSEGPLPPEIAASFRKMVERFQRYAPDWDGKPISPETSVRLVLGVVERTTPADSGAFLSHFGNKQWL